MISFRSSTRAIFVFSFFLATHVLYLPISYVWNAIFILGGLVSLYFCIFYTRNIYRIASIWYYLARPFFHYLLIRKLHDYKWITEEYKTKWNDSIHGHYAKQMGDMFRGLRGCFIKMAQRASTRPDVYPISYLEAFEEFLSNCPAEPFEGIKNTIETELGRPLHEIFSRFDETALGAASIGQAHRATLRTGEEVVVKVQYPWVGEIIDIDFATFLFVSRIFHDGEHKYLQGIMDIYKQELNFRREADTIRKVSTAINRDFDSRLVHVPTLFEQYCTMHVIVIEYFPGTLLSKYCQEARKGKDLKTEKFAQFQPPTDIQLKVIRAGMNLRRKMWNSMASILNRSVGGAFKTLGRDTNRVVDYMKGLDVNIDELLDTLIDVTGYQIFQLDVFNMDPHAGNILVDSEGRIGLIDFGQVWESTQEQRQTVARLMLALLHRDKEETIRQFKEMGFKTKKDDGDVIFIMGVFMFDCMDYDLAQKIFNVDDRKEVFKAFRKDRLEEFPPEYFAFVRVSMVLRGVCLNFLTAPSFAKCWEKYCLQILNGERIPRKKSINWFSKLTSFAIKSSTLVLPKAELQTLF